MKKYYPETEVKPNFPEIEEKILQFWNDENIFQETVDKNRGDEFVFYDGPPFANGLPHYGHVLQSYTKDTVARYQTMCGKKVQRKWGWDCHGLPPELKTEKELGISGKKAITEYGIDKFTSKCEEDVLKYTGEWKGIVNRLGRWVDMEHAYKTMDVSYSESILWAFKQLYEKGLLYEDFRILPYSWAAETPLSNFEVNQGYKDKTDKTAIVKFSLENGLKLLVWTTTPWTLPSNLMIAVGVDIEYSVYELDGENLVLATALVKNFKKELENAKFIKVVMGADLVGIHYEPLFPYFKDYREKYNAFQVLSGDFVSTTDGTGIVHIAAGFGEDDYNLCKKFNPEFPAVCPIDSCGCFTDEVTDFAGMQVFDTNEKIFEILKERKILFKKDQITHSYPFCWRTDKPLIYRAISSWFVSVEKIKDKIIAANDNITWIPEHIKYGRFGKWLSGARDWSISRNRFWGAPIPVWKSNNPKYPRVDVFGSIKEIEEASGQKVTNLHRPYIDQIKYKNPDDPTGQSMMERIPDVFDCWFESGAMPFASCHYPFENKEWFEKNFPADFITEATDQTRGWFYTLIVLSTAIFGKAPFKTCLCSGFVFDDKGQKLSKKLQNYSEPTEFFNKYGSDAFRWLLLSSPLLKGEITKISKEGSEIATIARKAIIPFYNSYHFFTLYANADGIKAEYDVSSQNILDKYILSKLDFVKEKAKEYMDCYNIAAFCLLLENFFDILNNWYIRLSRERFWGTSVEKLVQLAAFNTLYVVLVDVAKIVAPVMPFISDYIYKSLTEERSVHLSDFPIVGARDEKLMNNMDNIISICSAVKILRENENIRNRQPLNSVKICSKNIENIKPFNDLLLSECNVKEVVYDNETEKYAQNILYIYTPIVGKRLGAKLKDINICKNKGDYKVEGRKCYIAGEVLNEDEFEIKIEILNGLKGKATGDNSAVVILDTVITEELKAEGVIKDFIRAIQEKRKNLDFDVSDRIKLYFNADDYMVQNVNKWAEFIKKTTLATEIISSDEVLKYELDGAKVTFNIEKV